MRAPRWLMLLAVFAVLFGGVGLANRPAATANLASTEVPADAEPAVDTVALEVPAGEPTAPPQGTTTELIEKKSPTTPEWRQTDGSGDYLAVPQDSSSNPGATCQNYTTSSNTSLTLSVQGPHMYKTELFDYYFPHLKQLVRWQFLVYQRVSGDDYLVDRSNIQSGYAGYYEPVRFGRYAITGMPIGPTYVVYVRMSWHAPDGAQSGYGEYRLDYFKPTVTSSSGTVTRSVTNACYSPLAEFASISRTQVYVTSTINFSLRYYPLSTTVRVYYDGVQVGTVRTSVYGRASGSFKVPDSKMGTHRLTWTVSSWSTAKSFTVSPLIRVSPSSGRAGSEITARLTGYAARETVTVKWLGESSYRTVGSVTVSSKGTGEVSFAVPSWAAVGKATIRGDGTAGDAKTTSFTVRASPMCAPDQARGGYRTLITVRCTVFRSGETVDIYWDSEDSAPITSVSIGSGGSGSATFLVPRAVKGSHWIYGVGRTSSIRTEAVFTVTPRITMTPRSGPAGTRFTVRVYGFAEGEQVLVRWYRSSRSWSTFSSVPIVANADGYGGKSFTIPASASVGGHKVEAVGNLGSMTADQFTVTTSPTPTATPTNTPINTPTETPTETPTNTATPESTATNTAVPNADPTANAGPDQTVTDTEADGVGAETVQLVGSGSTDPEGGALVYQWSEGPTVLSTDADPVLSLTVGTHILVLSVQDDAGNVATDEVTITVESQPEA